VPKTAKESSAPEKSAGEEKVDPKPETEADKVLARNDRATTPGYYTLTDTTGAISVQIPSGWEYVMGLDSEVGANWSNFGGKRIVSSVTASSNLYTWHNVGGVSGTYAVASRTLALTYTDEELVASGPNDFSFRCEAGIRRDFERPPYSGRLQTWENCDENGEGSSVTLAAAPQGRECVVLLQVIMYGEGERAVGQHILDTFEVDCRRAREDDGALALIHAPGEHASYHRSNLALDLGELSGALCLTASARTPAALFGVLRVMRPAVTTASSIEPASLSCACYRGAAHLTSTLPPV
jgi:hypothetical protein